MRLNPFTMWWEHRRNNQAIISLAKQVGKDMHEVRLRLDKLEKKPAAMDSNLHEPLTPEQEDIVRIFNENRKLPEEIRRGFASGGHVGMRAALGRFGEAPSEQTRRADDVHLVQPGDVNIEVLIREEQRVMDREAWDKLDLDDIPDPKE